MEAPSEVFLSLVLPAYNESRRIGITLQRTLAYLEARPYTWELIVVDDGSTDGTAGLARQAVGASQKVQILSTDPNRGKGYSVKTGMGQVRGRYAGFMDADYKTDIACTEEALRRLEAGFEVVIGSRRLSTSRIGVQPKRFRQAASLLFNRYLHLLFPALRRFRDTQCGFKFFHREAALEIFPRLVVDRFMFDVELLYLAHRLRYRVCEIPVRWSSDPDSRTTLIEGILRNALDLIRIRKAHRRL